MVKHEWAIIGSGVTGISIAEILTRQGHDVVLIEKNETLASETTREFHEWLHTGSLYTLVPDGLKTLRFILGAVDDLMEYYKSYENMNIEPTISGLNITNSTNPWFSDNHINFHYRLKNRKITFPWLYGIARSCFLIEKIKKHDWCRRRGGELSFFKQGRKKRILKIMKDLIINNNDFYKVETSDFSINSRNLLRDMLQASVNNGLKISRGNEVNDIKEKNSIHYLSCSNEDIQAEKIVICAGESISDFTDVKTKKSYAPIAIMEGVKEDEKSFVELDYFPKNCINILTKGNGIGMVGGISLPKIEQCDEYLNFVINEHQKYNPDLKEIARYNGVKTEITFKGQPRNYLYHIVKNRENSWVIVPGKFTLAFSIAPEFYRQVYNINPKKNFSPNIKNSRTVRSELSNTFWQDSVK